MKPKFKVRKITKDDGQNVVDLLNLIDNQTAYLLFEPGERPTTPERIKELAGLEHENVFVAEKPDGELLGYILVFGSKFRRKKHIVELIIGVREEYRGQGIGTALIKHAEDWCQNNGITRIELTCSQTNTGACKLYKRLGYEQEGIKRMARKVDGKYYDDYYMSKILAE